MDSILLQKVFIENHPIKTLKSEFRSQYVDALIAYVRQLSNNDKTFLMICSEWCACILETSYESIVNRSVSGNQGILIRNGLKLKRDGLSFFRMKHQFFFDAFYLVYLSSNNDSDRVKTYKIAYTLLKEKYSNLFITEALDNSYRYFMSMMRLKDENGKPFKYNERKIPLSLRLHHQKNASININRYKKILVVANVSAGKSTLINAIIGKRINESRTSACTSRLNYIYSSYNTGMTIKSHDSYDFSGFDSYFKSNQFVVGATDYKGILNEKVCIIDTPGINNAEDQNHKVITTKAIEDTRNYNVAVYVSNCQYFGTNDEKVLLTKLINTAKSQNIPLIFVLNQLDKFKTKEDSIEKMLNEYESDLKKLGVANPVIIPISSRYAMLLRTGADGEDEEFELELLKKKFEKDFFNLPKYLKAKIGSSFEKRPEYRSGICCLEEVIMNNI